MKCTNANKIHRKFGGTWGTRQLQLGPSIPVGARTAFLLFSHEFFRSLQSWATRDGTIVPGRAFYTAPSETVITRKRSRDSDLRGRCRLRTVQRASLQLKARLQPAV
jgi:hypothetical protein